MTEFIPKFAKVNHQTYDGREVRCAGCKSDNTEVYPTFFFDAEGTVYHQCYCYDCCRFFVMWIAIEAAVGTEMSIGRLGDDTAICVSCGLITTEDELDLAGWCSNCDEAQKEYDRKQKEDGFENV